MRWIASWSRAVEVYIGRGGHKEEQAAFGRGPADFGRKITLHGGQHHVASLAVDRAQLRDVTVEEAVTGDFIDDQLVKRAGMQVGQLFGLDQFVDQDRRGRDPAQTQARREDLGEAARRHDHPFEIIGAAPRGIQADERGLHHAIEAQFAVGIVLDERDLLGSQRVNQLAAAVSRESCAAGILEIGHDVHQLGPLF